MSTEEPKQSKLRSPNFPNMPLDSAINKARRLYEKFFRNPVPYPVAMDFLGMSPTSSSSMQTVATLSSYGLILVEGSGMDRRLKVSDLLFTILKSPNVGSKKDAIKAAALKPPIFRKIKEEYSNQSPDDKVLAYDLEAKFSFNPKTIKHFLTIYRKTMLFANVYDGDIIQDEADEIPDVIMQENGSPGEGKMTNIDNYDLPNGARRRPAIQQVATEREIASYPAGPGLRIRITASGEGPVTRKAIAKLIRHLELDKEDFPEHEGSSSKESEAGENGPIEE
ncbi:MAG: hypothetical protein AB1640_16725 [bacterium]